MKESFVFYKSFYEAIRALQPDAQLEIYNALCIQNFSDEKYIFNDKVAEAMYLLMQPNIEASYKRYKQNKINGEKGGAPFGNQNARKYPKTTEKQPKNNLDIDIDLNIDNNKDLNSECENTQHTTPTLSELCSYCRENDMSGFDYENFYNYYESNGWINKNGTPIKNWKAKVNYWYKNDLESGKIKIDNRRRLD